MVNFAALDLNLLRVFDAMMIELSTVRAGERVGLTQPAVSSALGRLRQILHDDLFIRVGNRMVPTPKALALREPIRNALRQLEDAFNSTVEFDPARADHNFLIGGSDYVSTLLMPEIARSLMPEAPDITFQMLDVSAKQVFAALSEGKVDVALERELESPDWISRRALFRSFVVCVARKGHPSLAQSGIAPGGRIPLEIFCSIPHVFLSTDGSKVGSLGPGLRQRGLSRRIGATASHFQAVALAAASSDLLGNLPVRFAQYAVRLLDLDLYLPPFDPPVVQICMYWHRRVERDLAQMWLREKIAAAMDFDTAYPPVNLDKLEKPPWEA
ncbi:LysR family transcriptional regulator [Chelativorans salis]|uniref:LysR substrate-binding domain-containing protein n=1 Tax=Chelativorans salis TaxID=2978478 RepID=A0ABT2LVR9_9HYPH|nr:LysR family transcriptional regulator [Chelativorans sp. EGI FJ00035]MCT7377463.1 LysR substrate-binding domain-containing protein [Chelativorans sp. EGI FJ00035]